MQPNTNWQPDQDSGHTNNESVDQANTGQQSTGQYDNQTLQQIEDSVRAGNPRVDESLEDRRVPNVTINPLVNASSNSQAELPDYEVSWEAREYITTEKNTAWYIGLGVVVVVVLLLDIFLLKSYTVSVLILVIAAVLVVMTVRPAKMIQYRMNKEGISIDEQFVSFSDYKAFGLYKEHDNNSILLIPVKRFLPGLSIYFPEDQGEAIVELLARRLPNQEVKQDFMDKIVRLLRL